jgi:hypothetical protein
MKLKIPILIQRTRLHTTLSRQQQRKLPSSWIDMSSPPGIIQYVGTREVVQDYEMVRKALGYEKINFLGAS